MNNENELVVKLDTNIYFNFTEDKRADKTVSEIRFYSTTNDPRNSFLDIGYRSDNVKSIEDAKAEIERYRNENKNLEENLPPGQE